jgi:O-antigen ligase
LEFPSSANLFKPILLIPIKPNPMLKSSIRQFFTINRLFAQILVGCGFGLLLGMAFLWLSPYIVLGAICGAVAIYAMLKRPELALLVMLMTTSSILFENQLPVVSIGISLHIPDLLLLGFLALIVIRWLVEPGFKINHTPLDWPLLTFFCVTLISTLMAVFNSSLDGVEARRWMRVMAYYLTFFVVTHLVRERRQIDLLLKGLFLIATIVAGAMALQFVLGNSVQILSGSVQDLWTQGVTYQNVTRIVPPGFSAVLVAFMALVCTLVLDRFKPSGVMKFFQIGLLGVALIITFLRSYWAALIVAFILLAYILKGSERRNLFGWGLFIFVSASIVLIFVFASPESRAVKLLNASFERLSTLGDSGTYQGQDSSLNWRMQENKYALLAITAHPILGQGMGARYRPFDPRLDILNSQYDFRRHIHNGYLWLLIDTGLWGCLAFLWLSFVFLMRGWQHWRAAPDNLTKGSVLGFTLAYLVVLQAALANSTFVQGNWTPLLGIIFGVNEVIYQNIKPKAAVS